MTLPDDFSPIVAEGRLENERGLFGRAKRRWNLPSVNAGFERVIVDPNGKIWGGKNLSAGETYWVTGASWLVVDMGDQHLQYVLPVTDDSGSLGYQVALTVTASVTRGEAGEAVRLRARSVKPYLEGALREQVRWIARASRAAAVHPSPAAYAPVATGEPPSTYTQAADPQAALSRVDDAIRSGLRSQPSITGLPRWLTAIVTSVNVAFDQATEQHLAAMRQNRRSWELKELDDTQSMAARDRWREHLAHHLSNPAYRAIEPILYDPTQENIQRVVEQLTASEREMRGETLGVLRSLLDGNYVTDGEDVREFTTAAFKSVVDRLQAMQPLDPRPAAAAISGTRPDAIPASSITADQPIAAEVENSGADSQDWSDPNDP